MASRVFVITGASSGIGHAVAQALLARGHTVYGAARRVELMADLVAAGGHALDMDVTDESSVKLGIARVVSEAGRIDGLLANAGYVHMGMIENVSIEDAQHQFDVNVFGVARAVKAVLPQMRAQGGGSIVITSSALGKIAAPGMAWYPASKHALEAFSDALRMEVKRFGIRVAIIEPALVTTGILAASLPKLDAADQAEYAGVYATEQANFRVNAVSRFSAGSQVESVTKVVLEAFESESPKRRYQPHRLGRLGVFLKEKVGDVLLDPISTRLWLKAPLTVAHPASDPGPVECELTERPSLAGDP